MNALALTAYEADLCDGCGHPLSETTASHKGRALHTYELDLPEVCHACAAANRDLPEYEGDKRRQALKFRIIKKT